MTLSFFQVYKFWSAELGWVKTPKLPNSSTPKLYLNSDSPFAKGGCEADGGILILAFHVSRADLYCSTIALFTQNLSY
jgi:hypothetical protein